MAAFNYSSNAYLYPVAGANLGNLAKPQIDKLMVQMDYSGWLQPGEMLQSASYKLSPGTVPPMLTTNSAIGPTLATPPLVGGLVTFLLSQGQPGVTYALLVTVVSTLGRTKTDPLGIQVNANGRGEDCGPYDRRSPPGYPSLPGGYPAGFVPPVQPPAMPAQQEASVLNGNSTVVATSFITFSVGPSAPAPANILDKWWNTVDGCLYDYVTDGVSAFWINSTVIPGRGQQYVIAPTAPAVSSFMPGDMWWNSATSVLYILVNTGTTIMWAPFTQGSFA